MNMYNFYNQKNQQNVVESLSRVWLIAIPWIVATSLILSMGFSRQEYWSGLHFLLQGIFRTQGLNSSLLY